MIDVWVPRNDFARVRLEVIAKIYGGYEIHHPEYQVAMAERLIKEFKNEDITIRTHSPLFLEALEVYAEKYDVKISFYLWEDIGEMKKIEKDNLKVLYDNLGNPYDKLDYIRGEIDAKCVIDGRD